MKLRVDPAYIDKILRSGAFVEVSSPRPSPVDRPQRLESRHSHIEQEAMAACELVSTPEVIVVPAVDTHNRLMIVQMDPPQALLRESPQPSAYECQMSSARSAKNRAGFYLDIVTQLNNGTICTYPDLLTVCRDEQTLRSTLRAIQRFRSTPTSLQTIDGVVDLQLDKILNVALPDDKEVNCRTAFHGTVPEKGEVWVYLRLDPVALQSVTSECGSQVRKVRKVRKVRLEVTSNLRAVKLLQGLAFLDVEADVIIGRSYDLKTQQWRLTMKGFVDEALVIKSLGLLADMVPT